MSTKTKTFLTVGAFVLAALTCLMAVLNMFGISLAGIFDKKELNEDNLLKYEEHYSENQIKLDETSCGLKMKWNEDGSFVLRGKHSDEDLSENQAFKYAFASITLPAGTYTLSANNDDAEADTFGLFAEIGGTTFKTDNKGETRFDVTEDGTLVVIGFFIKNDYRILYEKICPTLVAGTDSIEFYK